MDPVLVTKGLSRRFGDNWAVRQLTLSVERGQVFGFLGPNGAGKTTTVRLMNGILEASEGSATVLGMNPITHGAEIRRHTGVLTESPSLYEALSARENLHFSGEVYGVPADELPGRINALLDRFGLLERATEKVGAYSRGMKQRLAVARALLHEPEIVFLDEPSAGLDPAAARDMLELVRDLSHRQGRTIFMCTHNLVEAERLCDLVGVIHRGRLRALGSPADLARQLWNHTLIEVDLRGGPDDPVRQAILNVRGVQGLDRDGDLTLVQVSDPEVAPALVQAIVSAGGRIYGLRQRNHGLEDVYFALEHGEKSETGSESSPDA
jgi:ABC-2 type transport system ATP-binding protein